MNQLFQPTRYLLDKQSHDLARQERRQLLNVFWFIAGGLFLYELFSFETSSSTANFGAILITATAILPSYLWCSGKALGMPIFPLFAFTFVWTYGLPLVTKHPEVATYSAQNHLLASVTTAGFLALGTLVWFQLVKTAPPLPNSYRALGAQKGDIYFLLALAVAAFFNVVINAGWLPPLWGGVFSAIRAVSIAITGLGSFVLAYKLGTQELSQRKSQLFLILLISYMISNAVGLLLVTTASIFLVATVGFIFGRKKLPVLVIVIALTCLTFLHYGKAEMRAKYWYQDEAAIIKPWEYPAWYGEWFGYTLDYFSQQNDPNNVSELEEKHSFLERSSVIQILLLAQDRSPESIPYLYGYSYSFLPQLLVPRIFNKDKLRSNTGTYILSFYYGLQTLEQLAVTSIGWGLLPESYANFGLIGCGGLGIVLGILYGLVTRWSINTPILSARSLLAVVFMTFALQTEWTAGVYVAAVAQSSIMLGGIVVFFMNTYRTPKNPAYDR
ncbi:MAG: hypothetical protein AAFV71_29315 [Cyanobacteria bacterium J06633_8]